MIITDNKNNKLFLEIVIYLFFHLKGEQREYLNLFIIFSFNTDKSKIHNKAGGTP